MKEKELTIAGVNYTIKKSFRSLMAFEAMTNKTLSEASDSITDLIILFYCMLNCNDNFKFSFDEFINIVDENNSLMIEFTTYLQSLEEDNTKEDKKKQQIKN